MTRAVADCAAADAVIAGEEFRALEPVPLAGLRLVIPENSVRGLDETVTARFSSATATLRKTNARLTDEPLGLLDEMAAVFRHTGNFSVSESYAIHRELLAKRGQDYDPIARATFERGRDISAADYLALMREHSRLVRAMNLRLQDADAFVLPTNKIVAPKISDLATLDAYRTQQQKNGINTVWVSFFDLCAISLPLPREGGLPVGLMLVAKNGHDHRLFRIAAAVERLFAG